MTSTQIIAVEGPSDRIVLNAAARAQSVDLDRMGVAVVELDGKDNYKQVLDVFGEDGFGIPMQFLLDEDAERKVARTFGTPAADLESRGVFISRKDLESEYVRAIGATKLWDALESSGLFPENKMRNCPRPQNDSEVEAISTFCGDNKILAAIVAAEIIESNPSIQVASISRLLRTAKR